MGDAQEKNTGLREETEGIARNLQIRLRNFPISFFATIMGLSGLTIAFQRAEMILKPPVLTSLGLSNYLFGLTVILFAILLISYLAKLVLFPGEVMKEINHPIRLSFFPTISICLLLFSIITLKIDRSTSLVLWGIGSILHLSFTIYIISVWIQHAKFQIGHFNASWFIPVVGNILVPVSGADLGFYQISWFFFSIGFVFWIVLMTILFNRLFFHQPLPERLIPTMFIMIAPPAVGFISYGKLNHEHLDQFGMIMYYFALFLFLLLVAQIKMFSRIRFYLSWWAYSFPIAAITIATMLMYRLMKAACAGGGSTPRATWPSLPAVPVAAAAPAAAPAVTETAIPVAPLAQVVPITPTHPITAVMPITSPITAVMPITSPTTAVMPITSAITVVPPTSAPPLAPPTVPAAPVAPIMPPPSAAVPHVAECAYTSTHFMFFQSLAYGMLVLVTLIIILLLTRTLIGVTRGEICVEE